MVKIADYFSQRLKRSGPVWHGARFVYCLLTGVVFSDIYHHIRLKRNAEGLRKYGSHYLRQVVEACEKFGAKPMLDCGTLLGYAKSGQFETGSKDIDLAVFSEDLKDPSKLIAHMKDAGFVLRMDGRITNALQEIGMYYLLQFHSLLIRQQQND